MNNYILFLCGGKWQLPWFLFLKEKGWKLILVDPYIDSPCVEYADVYFQCDVKNTDLIHEFVKNNGFEIKFVTSEQTDVSTLPITILSKMLDTKANSMESVERFSNKYVSRNFLKKNNFNHFPKYKKINTIKELVLFQLEISSDIIIKPSDSQSSRGVFVIKKESDLKEINKIYSEALKYTEKDYLLAEEFVEGIEITLEGLCFDKKHITLTGSQKSHFRTGIASNLDYPLHLNEDLKSRIINFHNQLIISTDLNFGITHSEYIINEKQNKFWLIEIACRGGGSLIPSKITPWVCGIDVYETYYNMIFNFDFEFLLNQNEVQNSKSAKLHFFEFKEGVVNSINGIDECLQLTNVFELKLLFSEGDHIYSATDDSSRQGYVIILADTLAEISETLTKIYNTIEIGYETNI